MTADTLILLLGAAALLAGLLHMPRPAPARAPTRAHRSDQSRPDWDEEDEHVTPSSGVSLFSFLGGSMQDDGPLNPWDDEDE